MAYGLKFHILGRARRHVETSSVSCAHVVALLPERPHGSSAAGNGGMLAAAAALTRHGELGVQGRFAVRTLVTS